MEIGSRIRQIRESKSIKLNELAHAADISRVYLSDIERNKKMPPIPTLERICTGLGITFAEFFAEEEPLLSPELRRLLETAKKLSPEQTEQLQKLLETMSKE